MAERLEGPEAVGHLLRRAGFGQSAESAERLAGRSFEDVLEELLADLEGQAVPDPPGFDAYEPGAIQQLWLERMLAGRAPLVEKLAFFWHGHFATSDVKVRDPQLMWNQYQLFRRLGAGSFRELLLGVSRDVAMIRWLDGNANRARHPNENYARELQELFTLGRGAYSEADIREVARAFSGWGSSFHEFVFQAQFHDDGTKTIHGQTGPFDGEDVVGLLVDLPACHSFIAGKLLRFFSHPEPLPEQVEALAEVFRARDFDIAATLRALFLAPAFLQRSSWRSLVKTPVEFAVGALRAAGFSTLPRWTHGSIDLMGQILFRPPSVKGWPEGASWLSSAGVVERLRFAQRLAERAPLEAAGRLEQVALDGSLPPELAEALQSVKGRQRAAMILGSPEFQLR